MIYFARCYGNFTWLHLVQLFPISLMLLIPNTKLKTAGGLNYYYSTRWPMNHSGSCYTKQPQACQDFLGYLLQVKKTLQKQQYLHCQENQLHVTSIPSLSLVPLEISMSVLYYNFLLPHTRTHAHMHACTHTCTHARTHVCTHTCTHAHMHTHTHTQ